MRREGDIRLNADLGGGSIWDIGGYPVSFFRMMLGTEPVEVHGWQNTSPEGVDLSFAGQLRFPGGAVAQFFSSFQSAPHTDVDILGTGGRIQLNLPYLNKVGVQSQVRIWRTGKAKPAGTFSDSASQFDEETVTYEDVNAYQCEVESMAACVLDGAEPAVPLAESRGNVAAVEALCKSAREGKPVQLTPRD